MELIDVHSHILPHMDHGSLHTATAIAQLELIRRAGTQTVCATSHFYPQQITVDTFLEERAQSWACLVTAMGNTPRPGVILGAEVLICEGMEHMEGLETLCYEGTNVLLLEMPTSPDFWTVRAYETVENIRRRGLIPLLAHVDRYPKRLVEPLMEMGIVGQINADALYGWIKPRHLLEWMDAGQIVAMGSDLHGDKAGRYKPFTSFVASGSERVTRIMQATAELLKDATVR